jgi:uncharacterized membrane protein
VRALCLFLAVSALTACGYQMVGVHVPDRSYYITGIYNQSTDMRLTKRLNDTVRRYFYNYGDIKSQEEADYSLRVTLITRRIDDEGLSASREALYSTLYVTYAFYVTNKEGKVMYDARHSADRGFSAGDSITQYNRNLEDAFSTLTEDILSEFKYAFETRY